MAGKKTRVGIDPHIDDFGFDEYDPVSPDIDKHNTKPINRALKGAAEGAKDAVLTKSTLQRLVRAAVPSGIGRTIDTVEDVANAGSDLYNSVSSQVVPEINNLKRNMRRIMPRVRDRLPNGLTKAIDNLIKPPPVTENYSYDPDAETIKSAMRDVFEAERLLQQHYRDEDKAEETLRGRVRDNRERDNISVLKAIRQRLDDTAAWRDGAATRRDQKYLELQYRQYFTQRDLLIETKNANVSVLDQLKALVENTSLPDIAKLKEYQQRESSKRKSLIGNVRGRVDDYVNSYRERLMNRLNRDAKRFSLRLKSGLSGANALAGQAATVSSLPPSMLAEMDSWADGGNMVGSTIAGDETLIDTVGGALGRQLRKIPGLARLNQRLSYFHDNAPEIMSDWAKQRSRGIRFSNNPYDMRQGFGAKQINQIKAMIPKFYEGTTEFTAGGFGGAKDIVSQDDLKNKTIIEIIPGILSAMAQDVRAIRTGRLDERQHYNHITGGFTSNSEYKESIQNKLLPKGQMEYIGKRADEFVNRLNRGKKLSPDALEALRKQVIHNMVMGRRFNAESFVKGKGLDQIDDPLILRELTTHFRKMFPVDAFGKVIENNRTVVRMNRFSNEYQDIRRLMPRADDQITNMLGAGAREQLREIGALKREGNREFFDPSFIVNALTGKGEPKNEDTIPDASPKGRGGDGAKRRRRRRGRGSDDSHRPVPPTDGDPSEEETIRSVLERLTEQTRADPRIDSLIRNTNELNERVQTIFDRNKRNRDRASNEEVTAEGNLAEDIYVPGEEAPRLTRAGFRAGRYYCLKTKRAIRRVKDIQGPVVDAAGNMLLDAQEMASGVITESGIRLAQLSKRAERWVNRVDYVSRLIGGRVFNAVDKLAQGIFGLRGKIEDVYVLGQPEPALTAAKMRESFYVDRRTKKPINTIDDIKGAVEDREGNVVLTWDDYDKGLYLKDGTLIRRSGLLYQTGRFINWYFGGYYRNLWKFIKAESKVAKKVGSYLGRAILGVPDCYVPGEDTPRLLARQLRRGMYLSSKTGSRIFKLSQIDSDVLGPDGEVVLTVDEMKNGLVDKYGKPIRGLGNRFIRKVLSIASAPTRLLGRYMRKTQHALGDAAVKTARGVTDAAGWAIDKLTGFRKGSWEERRFKREEADKEKARNAKEKPGKDKDKKPSWLAPLMMIGGLLKTGFGMLVDKLSPLKYLKDILSTTRLLSTAGSLLGGGGKAIAKAGGAVARVGARAVVGAGARLAATSLGAAALSGMSTIGTMLGAGVSVASTAAAAVASLVTAPVVITAAAVAAVGFVGWWAWKKYGSSPDPIQAVRLAEYGIATGDRDLNAKVLKLEEAVSDYVVIKASQASFGKDIPMSDVFKLFDLDANNVDNLKAFTEWFRYRFRPVYLKFAAKGEEIASGTKVHQQDDKIPDGEKPRLVRETRFSSEDPEYPYNVSFGPQPPQPAVTGTEAIDAAIAYVEKRFSKAERTLRGKEIVAQRRADNDAAVNGGKNSLENARKLNSKENRYTTDSKLDTVRKETISKHGDVGQALWDAGSARKIDELSGVRFRTYGLVELDKGRADTLTLMESDLTTQLVYSGDGVASLDFTPNTLFMLYGPRFGLNVTDLSHRGKFVEWLNDRFIPTFLAFASAVRKCDKSVAPGDAWKMLKAADQLKVAQATSGATTTSWFRKISVWTVDASPWPDYVLNMDSSSVNEAVASIRAKIRQEKLEETRAKNSDAPKVGDGLPEYTKARDKKDTNLANNINAALENSGVANLAGIRPVVPTSGGGRYNEDGDSGGVSGGYDGRTGVYGEGGQGDYASLPESKGDGWENNKELIVGVSKATGVDAGILATFAGIESDFKPGAGAGTSNAKGLYQFIPTTWSSMVSRYGAKYGLPPNANARDAKANALMGAEFLRENRDGLSKALGREPTDVDLYIAHFLGLDGARRFYKMSGNQIPAESMQKPARANPTIFYTEKGKGRARTRDEMMNWFSNRVQTVGRKYAGAAVEATQGGSGVADIDGKAQTPPTTDNNVVTVPEGDVQTVAGGKTDTTVETAPTTAVGGGYMGASSQPPAPLPPPIEPASNDADLSPVAEQALGAPAAERRTEQQIANRVPKAELVTNQEIGEIMAKQLTTQIEIRELLRTIAESRAAGNDAPSNPNNAGNDKSTTSNVTQRGALTTGPVNMKRTY